MKASTPELLKFQKLMRRLKESKRGTIGLLEGMWIAVARNCPQGDIGRFTNEEIAIMVDWENDPNELVQALIDCKWLDRCEVNRLVVHDWGDHCPTYVKGGLAKTKKEIVVATSSEVQAIATSSEVQAKVQAQSGSGCTSEVASTYSILFKPIQFNSKESAPFRASPPVSGGVSKRGYQFDPEDIPEALRECDAFRRAWETWLVHRRELRKPVTKTQAVKQLAELAAIGAERAVESIDYTIARGWQGLREPEAAAKKVLRTDLPF